MQEPTSILPFDVIKQARRLLSSGMSLKQSASYLYVTAERLDRSLWHWIGKTEATA